MNQGPTLFRRLALCALVAVLLLVTGAVAQADDRSAIERLSAEERSYLEANVPDWKTLDADRKEQIARNVLRIRKLSPEQRDVFLTRIAELKRHHEARRGPPPHRLHELRDPRMRKRFEQHGRLYRAVGSLVWTEMPKEGQETVRRVLGRRGPGTISMLYHRRVFELLAKKVAAAGVPEIALDEITPPDMRRRVEQWKKKAEEGDAKARQRLAFVAVGQDFQGFARRLGIDGPVDEVALKRAGAALKAAHPEVFEKASAEILAIVKDEEALKRYARKEHKDGRGRGRDGPSGSPLGRLLHALREAAPHLNRNPELAKPAQVLRKLLEKHLRGKDRGHPGRQGRDQRGPANGRPGANGRPFGPDRPGGGGRRGPGPRPPGPQDDEDAQEDKED